MEDNDLSYIIDNVISKVKYCSDSSRYVIKEEDYFYLKLSESKMKLLRRLCNKLDIDLEHTIYSSYRVLCVSDKNLFNEYNNIKDMLLGEFVSLEDRDKLELRRIEIRNKILEDNIEVINSLVDRRIDNIKSDCEREEIYHMGYYLLLEYIDNNYLYVDKFKKDVSQSLMLSLKRKVLLWRDGINEAEDLNLKKLRSSEKIIQEDISKVLDISYNMAGKIINLNNIVNSISYEDINNDKYYYSMFDSYIDKYSKREVISKLLLILPLKHQLILSLYFGFGDNEPMSTVEVSHVVGLSKQRVDQILNDALFMLRNKVVLNELEDLSGKKVNKYYEIGNDKKVELFLVMNLPLSFHNYLLSTFKKDFYREFYRLCFIEQYSNNDVSLELGITSLRVSAIKYKILEIVKYQIKIYLMKDNHLIISDDEYMNYLMKCYLTCDNIYKCRKR